MSPMGWLDMSTYALAACGAFLGLYLALTGRPLSSWFGKNLPSTVRGRRLLGGGSMLLFLAIAGLAWGVDKPQRGLSLLAFVLLLVPSLILLLRARAQPNVAAVRGPRISR